VCVCVCVCVGARVLLQSSTEVATARCKVWYEYWICKALSQSVQNSLLMALWYAQGIMVLQFRDHWPTVNTYGHCTALWHLTNVIWTKQTPSPNFFSTGIQKFISRATFSFTVTLCGENKGLLHLILFDIHAEEMNTRVTDFLMLLTEQNSHVMIK